MIIAETAFHDLYFSLPLKDVTILPCAPRNVHDKIKQQRPDIILLDCGFEVEKGLRMLKELKESYPQVPVIFLTDGKSYDTVVRAYRSGARDFVGKPANLFELRNTVENILKIKKSSKEARSPLTLQRPADREFLQGMTFDKPAPILRAIRHIEENLSNTITLDILAREAGLSKFHFSRLFYRHTKMTPVQFAARMKIEMAKGLLRVSGLNVSTVGQQVGFPNVSSFVRQFKNITGITPSDYKKSLKKS